MAETIIPKATAKRLPVYYRYLNFLANSGTTKISSTELSDAVKVDSATIRRDFSYLVHWVNAVTAMMSSIYLISLKRF